MPNKPKCECWSKTDSAAAREQEVDGIGRAFMHSVDAACRDLGLCSAADPYVGGSVVAAIIFWVAYDLRGDGERPTGEEIAAAGELVVAAARDRLAGSRYQDLDMVPPGSVATH